jgi:hypothetical protein
MVGIWFPLGFVLGFVVGCALSIFWNRPVPVEDMPSEPVPQGVAPAGGTAVLVNAAGEDVSRRTLTRNESRIQRPHGKGRAETFVYVGLRSDGCHEFRSVR